MWRQARLSSFAVLDSRVDILSDAVFAWWSPSPIPFSSSLQSIIPNRLQMGHIVERCEDCTILIFFAFTEICFEFKQTVCLAQNHTEHNAWELNKTHCLTTRKGNDEWENIEFWEMFFVKKKEPPTYSWGRWMWKRPKKRSQLLLENDRREKQNPPVKTDRKWKQMMILQVMILKKDD